MEAETADVQLWCEDYVRNQTLMEMATRVNGTLGIQPDTTVWSEMNYIVGLKLFAYAVIFVGGLLGNISVILTVFLNRSMRNVTNYYVASLAVSDALICVFCMLPEAMETITKDYIFNLGKFMCNLYPFTTVACLASSSLTLTAISCDRSVAILYPFRSRVTKQRTSYVIAFIWVVSIAVAVPNLFNRKYVVHKFDNYEVPQCHTQWSETYQYYAWSEEKCHSTRLLMVLYIAVISTVLFFLPMLIMVTAYSLILWRLWRTELPGERHAANVDAHTRMKWKVNKMVFVVLVVFIICWTPQEVILFTYVSMDSTIDATYPDWYDELYWFAGFLANSNSFLNPFIYGGFDKSFLKGFLSVLRCGSGKKTKDGSDCSKTTDVLTKSATKMPDQGSEKSVELAQLEKTKGNASTKALNSQQPMS